jgi:hypothetical protein
MVGGAGVAIVNRETVVERGRSKTGGMRQPNGVVWIWSPGYCLYVVWLAVCRTGKALVRVVHVVVHVAGKVQRSPNEARKRKRRLLANANDETRKGSQCPVPRRIGGETAWEKGSQDPNATVARGRTESCKVERRTG